MATFSDFIATFDPDPGKRGRQFEHFVKWFLTNDPEWATQVDEVWLWQDYPGRWGRDCGIDLVFRDKNGSTWAVQAKCYSPSYEITKADVDRFLSESNRKQISHRLLIATTDGIGVNARQVLDGQEKSIVRYHLNHFENAAVDYPDSIERLALGKRKLPPDPRPHQIEAVENIISGFGEAARGQLVMACGTGKTFVCLWVKERLANLGAAGNVRKSPDLLLAPIGRLVEHVRSARESGCWARLLAFCPRLNEILIMITAYFDDSGTHGEKADIVLVAGVLGTEARMECLDRNWKRLLEAPVDGLKDPIKRFHAYDCDNSINEFERWTRTETDYFRHQLRTAIIESDCAAYGMACSRKDWDRIITGDLRSVIGDPEGFCINQCVLRSVAWVQAYTFDPRMKFVFDNRPGAVQRYAGTVYDAFEKWIQPPPQLTGCKFSSSMRVRCLQAADLVAWELYRYANVLLKKPNAPAHQELLHLHSNMDFNAQIATREKIKEVRDHWLDYFKDKPGWLEQFANHFDFFDPTKPDYSALSG